ncbi:DUF896 domain-containing protein [Jeotgalibaca caeni]|uniref:DUF896 domain-containing protein n=1 Tax=Jeotgalibaca caeni TaxID=3028623 RepID=UPI003B83A3BA
MDHLLKRINELAKKAKTPAGLTEAEKTERATLREEYLQNFRGSMNEILLNSTVYDPEGNDVTPKKLKRAQREVHLKNAQDILKKQNITFLHPQKKED